MYCELLLVALRSTNKLFDHLIAVPVKVFQSGFSRRNILLRPRTVNWRLWSMTWNTTWEELGKTFPNSVHSKDDHSWRSECMREGWRDPQQRLFNYPQVNATRVAEGRPVLSCPPRARLLWMPGHIDLHLPVHAVVGDIPRTVSVNLVVQKAHLLHTFSSKFSVFSPEVKTFLFFFPGSWECSWNLMWEFMYMFLCPWIH